jgi:hypothetical protein
MNAVPVILGVILSVNFCLGRADAAPSIARVWNEELLQAIRINVPNPPAHARNLFHLAAASYNGWAAYDPGAVGYLSNEKAFVIAASPTAIAAARHETISYAAYRLLRSRFTVGIGAAATLNRLNATLTSLGYSTTIAQAPLSTSLAPAELGKRIAQAIITWGSNDGFSGISYPQSYNIAVNPNLAFPLSVLGTNLAGMINMPLGYGVSPATDPNLWQPLDLATSISQNGIPTPGGPQTFVGVQGLSTVPFSLTRADATKPWLDPFGGPSRRSTNLASSATDAIYKAGALAVIRDSSRLNDPTPIDISPATIGNNPLGSDAGSGTAYNPITGVPYAQNTATRSDYARVLAEYWADGPNSETPPGHWHVLANQIADMPNLTKKIRGLGPSLDDLEWDVKVYFALAGATHDAACAAWSLKRYYSGARPITMIRCMAVLGQCTDPGLPSYHPHGLPLELGVSEVILPSTILPGERHAQIWDIAFSAYRPGANYLSQIAIFSWPGENPNNPPAPALATQPSPVRWQLAKDWLPFQRKTFNTPAFPGYVSGHSAFSRAAAEALTLLTGSPYFPGGFHHHTVSANSLQIDLGPSAPVDLQWCRYSDAADQAGQSRRWGGIHVSEDDYHGRVIGAAAGISAFQLAERYWTGTIAEASPVPALTLQPNGAATITWNTVRGVAYRLQSTTDLSVWTDLTASPTVAYQDTASFTDSAPSAVRRFYRVTVVPTP